MNWFHSVCIALASAAIASAAIAYAAPVAADNPEASKLSEGLLQARLDDLQAQQKDVPGFAIAVIKDGNAFSAATGIAAPDGTPMTARTPFRLASVTKTFVAAAILRLYEQGKLDLDTPIGDLVSEEHLRLLRADGYNVQAITVRHLLMHSGGLNDHFGTAEMREMVFANPDRVWTRTQQLRLMTEMTERVGLPGERFVYSDTGYLLLGEIIEKQTGTSLTDAVRALNRFDKLGIGDLRWEGEQPQSVLPDQAHQWLNGFDTFAIHGSVDAFGGGGLIGDVVATATYFDALFGGSVFSKASTLRLMQVAPSQPAGSPYRIGLFEETVGDQKIYMHGGFWGVIALHVPAFDLTVVGVALDQSGEPEIRQFAFDLIAVSE